MSNPSSSGLDDYMRDFDCPLEKEFEFNGHAASWASTQTRARFWDEEDESLDLPTDIPIRGRFPASAVALSPDGKFLAVAVNTVVRLYDSETFELRAQTVDYPSNVQSISFPPADPTASSSLQAEDSNYVLVSQNFELEDVESKVYKTVFDHVGRRVNDSASFPLPLSVGAFPQHGSRIWKHDGSQMLYVVDQTSTTRQPQVVVSSMPSAGEICRLRGHRDAITWVSWSADGTIIATASRDRTIGIWVSVSGVRRHSIRTNGGNWCGEFLNNGRHILLSGATVPEGKFGIYDVESADLIVALHPPEGIRLDRWLRDFAVHPSRELVVLRNGRSLLAWTPFGSDDNLDRPAVQTLLAIQPDPDVMRNGFGGITTVKWVDRGRKLVAQGEDETIFVWEPERQWEWRFQRPKGRSCDLRDGAGVHFVRRKQAEWILSLGVDRIRLWKL